MQRVSKWDYTKKVIELISIKLCGWACPKEWLLKFRNISD